MPCTILTVPPGHTYQSECPECKQQLEFNVYQGDMDVKSTPDAVDIKCFLCQHCFLLNISVLNPLNMKTNKPPKNNSPQQEPKKKSNHGDGTKLLIFDLSPLDTTYYDLLNVHFNATPAAIKKAYYTAAMKSHPDKNPSDPLAEDKFKAISEAYQGMVDFISVLSDPHRRSLYNQNGINSQVDGTFVDPEQFFKQHFGGDKFVSIIGEISIARDFKDAMLGGDESNQKNEPLTSEQRILQRKKRVDDLCHYLNQKLELYTLAFPLSSLQYPPVGTTMEHLSQEALNSFRILAQVEVGGLKDESYGVELLHAIGYTYVLKSDQWMAVIDGDGGMFKRTWGYASRFTNGIKEKAHIIRETVGTVKTAFDLQSSFTKLQDLDRKGGGDIDPALTQEEQELKIKLEQEAAAKGLEALWRGSKLEVQAVLREVCDQTLGDATVDVEIRKRRAVALRVLGEVYESTK